MANFQEIKKRSKLGVPPDINIISANLQTTETIENDNKNKSQNTQQLATKITPKLFKKIKTIALEEGITISLLIEKAINNYTK